MSAENFQRWAMAPQPARDFVLEALRYNLECTYSVPPEDEAYPGELNDRIMALAAAMASLVALAGKPTDALG